MSWFSRVVVVLTVVLSAQAIAHRIEFRPGAAADPRAILATHALSSRDEVPPMEIRLDVPTLDVDKAEDGFDRVGIKGLFPETQAGKPELQKTGTLLAVPAGFEPKIEIVEQEVQTVDSVFIRPVQKKFRCQGPPGSESFEFDSRLYQSDELFPKNLVTLEEAGKLQSLRLVRIAIAPLQFRAKSRSLLVTHHLVIRVSFKRVSRDVSATEMSPTMFQLARSVTANGAFLGGTFRSRGSDLMVILVADELKNTVAPLVEWKKARGIEVKVVTQTELGKTKENIQKYLQDLYNKTVPKPTYFVFVGNKTSMPVFMESTSGGKAASDYRFALLSGADQIPDVLYGRVVADNAAEAELQISRWIQYEKSPEIGTWYPQAMTISSAEGSNPSDKEYAEMTIKSLKAGTYKKADVFNEADGNANESNISTALSEGRSWVSYWGHGSGTAWGSVNDSFGNGEVADLSNGDKLPILVDVACSNASWVNLSKCFGKAWVTQTSKGKAAGAVGYYGGSVTISWHEPAVMAVGVAKYHFEKPVYTLGGSVLAGQLYLIEKMGTGSNVIENLMWYNLFGDPSLLVRTNVPQTYDVKNLVSTGSGEIRVDVTSTATDGSALKGLVASLTGVNGVLLASASTDAQGKTTLVVPGLTQPSSWVLTTSGYNLETKQVAIP